MRRRRIRLTPGDVFAVPLGGGSYAYGRLTPQKGCAEFLGVPFTALDMPDSWHGRTMVRLAELIVVDPIEEGRWPIIGNIPWGPREFDWQHYMVGSRVTCAEGPPSQFTDVSSETRPPEAGEWHRRPKLSIWNEAGVMHALRKKLGVAEQGDEADER